MRITITEQEARFYELSRGADTPKKRRCLSCRKSFISQHKANAICAPCKHRKSHHGFGDSRDYMLPCRAFDSLRASLDR